jgi:hypothetical protein
MNHNNTSLTSSVNYTLNRNSYGFKDPAHNLTDNPINRNTNVKPFQPYTPTQFHDNNNNKVNSIKFMENRVEGVEAIVKTKKNFL